MQDEDLHLLCAVARITLSGDAGSFEAQMATPVDEKAFLPKSYAKMPMIYPPTPAKPLDLQYFNGLGGFGPEGNEYVIRLESGQNTPAPWVNVLANQTIGCIASASGSGFTWHGNSHENKLTPWSNDAVSDGPGEAFYISDVNSGECFTITAPAHTGG